MRMNMPGTEATAVVRTTAPGSTFQRLRRLLFAVFTAQYVLVAICAGLAVAGTVRYVVSPQVVGQFEAIATALKRR